MTTLGKFLYSKVMKEPYEKPRYRMTITPTVLYWEVTHIWVLKHWGKKIACTPGMYQHKFSGMSEIIYYRID